MHLFTAIVIACLVADSLNMLITALQLFFIIFYLKFFIYFDHVFPFPPTSPTSSPPLSLPNFSLLKQPQKKNQIKQAKH